MRTAALPPPRPAACPPSADPDPGRDSGRPGPDRPAGAKPGALKGKSKYRNTAFVEAGVRWDSRREYRRWRVLWALSAAGRITGLKRQVRFPLTTVCRETGERVKVGVYVADFAFHEGGKLVVEDAKGLRLPMYVWKKRHMAAEYGIEIVEV